MSACVPKIRKFKQATPGMQSAGGATQVGVRSEVRGHIRPWISLAALLRAVTSRMQDFSHGPTHFYFSFLKGVGVSFPIVVFL